MFKKTMIGNLLRTLGQVDISGAQKSRGVTFFCCDMHKPLLGLFSSN